MQTARLHLAQTHRGLEVLVEDVDHPIAEAPEEEERRDENEGDGVILPVGGDEDSFFGVGRHGVELVGGG